jgi:pantetheine-phosphate adenylyltransferase
MAKCVFAGTFDPITIGHTDIIDKCAQSYQKVLVVIGRNPQKECLLTENERLALTKKAFENNPKVQVVLYSDYLDAYPQFLKDNGYSVYVRGVRNQADYNFEKLMEQKNQAKYPFITTEYVWASENLTGVSSSLVKQLILEGKDYKEYVPKECYALLQQMLKNKQIKN